MNEKDKGSFLDTTNKVNPLRVKFIICTSKDLINFIKIG